MLCQINETGGTRLISLLGGNCKLLKSSYFYAKLKLDFWYLSCYHIAVGKIFNKYEEE